MLDMRKFLKAHWADEAQLCDWIRIYGETPPKRPAAAKWFLRESIPSQWFGMILMLKEIEDGAPVSLIRFRA